MKAFNEHIIDIHLYHFAYLLAEHMIHKPLIYGSEILSTKEHDYVVINPGQQKVIS